MPAVGIGDWVRRENLAVWHLVESVVAGDAIARCGLRLSHEATKTGGELLVAIFVPGREPRCHACAGRWMDFGNLDNGLRQRSSGQRLPLCRAGR